MNRNDIEVTKPAFGIAAALMTAIVLTLAVYVPARVAASQAHESLASARAGDVTAAPLRIEVVGSRTVRAVAPSAAPTQG